MFENSVPKHRVGVLLPLAVVDNAAYEFYRLAPKGVIQVMIPIGLGEFSKADVERALFKPLASNLDKLMERDVQMVVQSGAFALNIVGTQSKHLEDYFYSARSRQPDNLAPFALEVGRTGTPLLRDALASLDCRLVSSHMAGDHTLFVGEVVEAYVRSTDRPLTSQELPYVYLGGKVLFDQTSRRPLGPE